MDEKRLSEIEKYHASRTWYESDAILEVITEIRELHATKTQLLDALEDVVHQSCANRNDVNTLDSCSLRCYADAMHVLADHGRIVIDREYGRRVIAHYPPSAT
jgi:hypothetical protein